MATKKVKTEVKRGRGRPRENAPSLFGKWLDRHKRSTDVAAEAVGISRQSMSALASGLVDDPKTSTARGIEDWTRSIDPGDYVAMQSWRAKR